MLITILTCVFSFLVNLLGRNRINPEMVNRIVVNIIMKIFIRGARNFWEKIVPISMINTEVVPVAEGLLRGREIKSSFNNVRYFSFRGIPYGKPPAGSLRFKDPEPAAPWEGIRDALREGNQSPQVDFLFAREDGNEDCLYLNVHTPKLPSNSNSELLPVIFWIHGGGFSHGNGNSDLYGPEYLLQHNVLVVTCNYRLGILGFLSLGYENVSGNFGLKDQLLALQWVNRNIASFGGDPNNVTIYGESAGAASVHFHILSPKSKGLFQRAIAHSGSALNPWVVTKCARERAFQLGEILGCKTDNDQLLIDFLRTVPARELLKNSTKVLSREEKINNSLAFSPVVEPPGPNAFISEDPRILLQEGRFNQVPCIFALNSCEGMLFLRSLSQNKKLIPRLNADPAVMTSVQFQRILEISSKREEFGQKLKKVYFNDKPIDKESLQDILDIYSDYTFIKDVLDALQYHALAQKSSDIKTYFLFFSFEGSIGFLKKLFNGDNLKGVCHGDDLSYVFPLWLMGLHPEKNSPEEEMIYQMTKRFTNFAKTSDPNSDDLDRLKVHWEAIDKDNLCYLELNSNPQMKYDPLYHKRMQFWQEAFQMVGYQKPITSKM